MNESNNGKKTVNRRDLLIQSMAVGAAILLAPRRGHGQFIPFNFLGKQGTSTSNLLQTIPGTVQTAGSANATNGSYYLLIDSTNSRLIFTTGNRVNASSQLYTLPRYLLSGNSISITLGMTVASGTIYCVGGGGGGGGSSVYGCGWGGSSGQIYISTCSLTNGETATVDIGLKVPPHTTTTSTSNANPYWSRAYFSASKYVQAGGGGGADYSFAPVPMGSTAGVSVVTNTYNADYSGQGYCNDNYYYSQSGTSGTGYAFMGANFGSPGTYYRNNDATDGMVCIQFS